MLGRKSRAQLDLFITGSLEKLVPEEHILACVNPVLDLGWHTLSLLSGATSAPSVPSSSFGIRFSGTCPGRCA